MLLLFSFLHDLENLNWQNRVLSLDFLDIHRTEPPLTHSADLSLGLRKDSTSAGIYRHETFCIVTTDHFPRIDLKSYRYKSSSAEMFFGFTKLAVCELELLEEPYPVWPVGTPCFQSLLHISIWAVGRWYYRRRHLQKSRDAERGSWKLRTEAPHLPNKKDLQSYLLIANDRAFTYS